MSGSPEDYGPRRVFDGQGWGTVLTLALSGGWSRGGNGLIGLVADVQPHTTPAGLRWGLRGAVLFFLLLLLTVKAVFHGMSPVVVHMQRESKRPRLCLLQQLFTFLVLSVSGYVQGCLSSIIYCPHGSPSS